MGILSKIRDAITGNSTVDYDDSDPSRVPTGTFTGTTSSGKAVEVSHNQYEATVVINGEVIRATSEFTVGSSDVTRRDMPRGQSAPVTELAQADADRIIAVINAATKDGIVTRAELDSIANVGEDIFKESVRDQQRQVERRANDSTRRDFGR